VLSSLAATHYVSPTSIKPLPPFVTWDTAAQNIQDAVDVAADHDEVVVTNGVYDTGGAALFETQERPHPLRPLRPLREIFLFRFVVSFLGSSLR
jgi:hypothetical protein